MSGADQPTTGDRLLDIVRLLWPDLLTEKHIFPFFYYDLLPVQKTHLPADFAQQCVLHNLQQLADRDSIKGAMFVLSELNFKDYLNKPFYAKQTGKLPKPGDSPQEHGHHGKQGDFDILLIHRQHGILVGEIKSVGRTEASRADSEVAKVLGKAVQQLDKCEVHARHMVSDVAPGLTIRKTLFLPCVSRAQLQRVLDDQHNAELQQAVCRSLGAASTAEAVYLCCCSDLLSPSVVLFRATSPVLPWLSDWWRYLMARTVDTVLTDDLYLHIVARFLLSAATISGPCLSGARLSVDAELGRNLTAVILSLQQLDLLCRDFKQVFITGPPGTGKTLVLILQGARWAQQGHDVTVLSLCFTTRAITRLITSRIKEQLQRSVREDSPKPGTVSCLRYLVLCEQDMERVVQELLARVKEGRLHLIVDDAHYDKCQALGQNLQILVSRLTEAVPSLRLWTAGTFLDNIPSSLQPVKLTIPLRSAPAIFEQVRPLEDMVRGGVLKYISSGLPAPGDGQRVIRLSHSGDAHTGRWPVDCFQCGKNIATELRRLGVGCSGGTGSITNSTAPLSYRDVFILTQSSELRDDVMDDAGQIITPVCDFVRGLRDDGFPVCVVGLIDAVFHTERWDREMEDVAVGATDRVAAAYWHLVQGLERRVVVVLPGVDHSADFSSRIKRCRDFLDTQSYSRCTTHLIVVDEPSLDDLPSTTTTTTTATNTATSTTTATTPTAPAFTQSQGQASREPKTNKSDTGDASWCRKGFLQKPDKPVTDNTVTDKPVTDNTVTDKPVTDNTVTDNTVTDNTVTDKPVTDNTATDNTVTDNTVTDNTVTDNSGDNIQSSREQRQQKGGNSGTSGVSWVKKKGFLL